MLDCIEVLLTILEKKNVIKKVDYDRFKIQSNQFVSLKFNSDVMFIFPPLDLLQQLVRQNSWRRRINNTMVIFGLRP